ncbi:putative E3 ubiquitin-protein ligase ARI8 [Ananas comosus]|uniref:RBR-type E3 ubiquitin transferase n=1 Tax=Ananas comosus TaxID=4615 RepID=A0A199VX72_ANACO|nr:putative E3 ubiquitin-protein ligase ARI8 [Ananas comosus]
MVVREKPFTVLSEDDIRQRQEEDISKTVAILSISKAEAFILLRHFKWDENRVNDEWFANEVAVRRAIGLLENRVEIPKLMELSIDHLTCGICFETYPPNMMSAAACGHRFCGACWQGYIGTSISNGPGCLTLRCPDPSCSAAILQDMINFLATDEDKEKYARFYFRSYVEDGRKIKWCPAQAVILLWNITKEVQTMMFHVVVHSAFAGMLCLGVWSEHGERTGGFYACNRYESAKKEGVSRQKAFADLQSMRNEKIAKLREIIKEEESQLSFVIDAWSQIVECRRVLKWTYAYGYYLPDHELARKHFFEYLQGEAESGLERLHQCAEKELQVFFDALPDSPPTKEFCAFKTKLAGLTAVTRTYFENLVQALENGLEDVSSASQVAGSSTSKSQSTKGKAGKNKAAKLAVPQISPDDYWACDRCTFNNHPSAKRCEMCSHHQ